MRKITPEQAGHAYDILVRHAGARAILEDRLSFVYHVAGPHPTMEYRFGGNLGWGGKFRNNGNRNNTPHVDCYREHENLDRQAAIENTNFALAEIFATPSKTGETQ